MKYLIFTLSFVATIFTFTACQQIDLNAQVDYYIDFTETDKLDQLDFHFSGARANQLNTDGSETIHTIYLDESPILVKFGEPVEPIFLGSSDIEPSAIKSIDLIWGSLGASLKGEPLTLDYSDFTTHEKEIQFAAEQKKTITFLIDSDASFTEQSDGSFKFEPVLKVQEK